MYDHASQVKQLRQQHTVWQRAALQLLLQCCGAHHGPEGKGGSLVLVPGCV